MTTKILIVTAIAWDVARAQPPLHTAPPRPPIVPLLAICDVTDTNHLWTFNSGGELSVNTTTYGVMCLAVNGCVPEGNQPVSLVPCGGGGGGGVGGGSSGDCTSGWSVQHPHYPAPKATAPVYLVPPRSANAAPYCLQSWKGKGAVNVYCCSGDAKDCK